MLPPQTLLVPDLEVLLVDEDPQAGDWFPQALTTWLSPARLRVIRTLGQTIQCLYAEGDYEGEPHPELVLLAYQRPQDGGRIVTLLKEDRRLRMIPVIALCPGDDPEVVEAAYRQQVNVCLRKPLQAQDLTEDVETVLRFWRDQAVLRRSLRRSLSNPS